MSVSYQLSTLINRYAFDASFNGNVSWSPSIDNGFDKNNVFTKAILINISNSNSFFVPVTALSRVETSVSADLCSLNPVDLSLIMPLIVTNTTEKRTSDSILKFILGSGVGGKLIKVKSKDTCYYGCSGLIFDSNWIPLLILGFKSHVDKTQFRLIYDEPVIYLSPSTLTNTDLISKTLIKKVVPYIIENWRSVSCKGAHRDSINMEAIGKPVRVIIEDVSHMIYTPVAPKSLKFSKEISEMLAISVE